MTSGERQIERILHGLIRARRKYEEPISFGKRRMTEPAAYKWHTAYQSAVLGTGPGTPAGRITTALQAIDQRLASPPAINDAEHNEIQDALLVLHALKAQGPLE